ncbi:MAG TPA: DMT family transporter, partial [Rhizomicrobium sp.]|nr:DMT family transporter [Rhizomicrobium sp.]
MTTSTTNLILSFIMFATGVGIPIMAALNSKLGGQLGSPWAAAFLLFAIGAVISGAVMAFAGMPHHGWFVAPPLYYGGAVLVAFYVLAVTYSAPRIGVANAIFFVLVGQIVAAAAIDQFGLF